MIYARKCMFSKRAARLQSHIAEITCTFGKNITIDFNITAKNGNLKKERNEKHFTLRPDQAINI